MRIWSITLALLAVTIAGCAEDAAPEADEDEAKFQEFDDLEVDEDKGAIRGIILDPTITPIQGATVVIEGLEMETVSNADGAFVFTDLEPGTYFLEVSKLGYTTTQTSTNVEAGVETPPIVKVQLVADPTSLPFVQTYQFDGFMQCSFTAGIQDVRGLSANACAIVDIFLDMGFSNELTVLAVDDVPDYSQTEMVWESTQPTGDRLSLMYSWDCDTNGGFLCDHQTTGVSPLTLQANRTVMDTAVTEEGLMVRVFGTSSDSVPDPIRLGATIEQEFTHFTNTFYGFMPDEGWSFVNDGTPVPPS